MMIFFFIILVAIALFLQKCGMEHAVNDVDADHEVDCRVVEPEESFSLKLSVENRGKRIIPFVKVQESLDGSFAIDASRISTTKDFRGMQKVSFTSWLLPGQRMERRVSLAVRQRGRYVIHGLSIHFGDFLGLREEVKPTGRFQEVVVAPKRFEGVSFDVILGGFLGDVSARRFIFEDPILTLGYSEYTGREPMKTISWAQSARRNMLLVKKPDYTLEPTVSILLNVESDLHSQTEIMETCFSMVRSVCETLERQNCRYSFVTNARLAGRMDEASSPIEGMGRSHFDGVMEQLGRATADPTMTFTMLLQKELQRQTSAGRILITPGGEELNDPYIERLREVAGGQMLRLTGKEVTLC